MTRDILDFNGNVIGTLELPDDTPEEIWEERLNEFKVPPPVPVEEFPDVTPRQMRQALILSGVTAQQIEDAINSFEEPTRSLAMVEWEYSTAFQRHRPLVQQVGAMLGWTPEMLDDLWRLARTL